MTEGLYLYGLTRERATLPDGLSPVDAGHARVEWLDFGDLSALVSPIAATRLDPLRRHLLAHTRILEAALAAGAVLPMRFGAIVKGRERLAALIHRHRKLILGDLARLDGCIEIGVKASWSRGSAWRRVGASDPALAADCANLSKADPNAAYFSRIDAGRRIAARLAELRAAEAERLDALVAPYAIVTRTLSPVDDMMFAHRALLGPRAREPGLFAALKAYAGDDVDLRYVAPVPPYNFVDLRLSDRDLGSEAA